MILSLYIKNYAIIEELEMDFSKGLTIITGETGAGKSILLGALGLILGRRADTKSLFQEDKKCVVEAVFNVAKYDLAPFFETNELDYEKETVIRREIAPSGKSRAFINDTPVNLKLLQQLSENLVDLHQQFDTLDIHNVSFQLRMVDALADNEALLSKYRQDFRRYQRDKKHLSELIEKNENASREIDFLTFQLKEFNDAELSIGEQEELEGELSKLINAEEIKSRLFEAYRYLSESEPSILGQLKELEVSINQIIDFHPSLKKVMGKFESLSLELQEVANDFEKIAEGTEYNPERIEEIKGRLDLVYKLQNKHQANTIEDLINIQEKIEGQLTEFSDLSSEIEQLQEKINTSEQSLYQVAEKLSKRRQSVVGSFEKRVHKLLKQLAMEHSQLKVEILPLDFLTPTGTDQVEFLFAPNKGSRFESIKRVASGGEISRLTLCIKSLVASSIPLPTLIFDEIDSGISGDVAIKMGNILRKLSNVHQVAVITHSPQVASKADTHYFIYKKTGKFDTKAKVRKLTSDERIRAIATMLSQNPPSESAIENAKELLAMV